MYIAEGEKDVDRLREDGAVATCNAFGGGKGKWTRYHSRFLAGRHVIILPDNDRTGAEHAESVARSLHRVAASVKVIHLPDLAHKGDVSDYFDSGKTLSDLEKLSAAAATWCPPMPKRDDPKLPTAYEEWERDYHHETLACTRQEIYRRGLHASEKLCLLMLNEFDSPIQIDLASNIGVSPRRIRQMLATLKERGLVKTSRTGRRNKYTVDPTGHPPGR